ncbi:MAG TPA: WecB/TagA/CpsF family glycosyltransferase [bacterium]|nr:WecB/TagA/CpsF family glycosyltransferase [bacterium]
MSRTDVLGVGFDPVDLDGAVTRVVSLASQTEPHLIVTANVEMVMLARREADVREILCHASLVVADGVGVVWGSRQLGRPLPARVPGIDLAARLCEEAVRRQWRVYLLGGRPGIAAGAAARLGEWYPGVQLVGTRDGYFAEDEEHQVLRAIRDAAPTLLLAGLGAPRQERWLWRYLDELRVPIAMGIGGALDVWTGRARRAPRVWQTLGLEWCYRLVREPRRFGRQLAIPHFMAVVYAKRLRLLLGAALPR